MPILQGMESVPSCVCQQECSTQKGVLRLRNKCQQCCQYRRAARRSDQCKSEAGSICLYQKTGDLDGDCNAISLAISFTKNLDKYIKLNCQD